MESLKVEKYSELAPGNWFGDSLLWTFKSCSKWFESRPEIYILSAPNNSNETHTFMCLGRIAKTALEFKYEIYIG